MYRAWYTCTSSSPSQVQNLMLLRRAYHHGCTYLWDDLHSGRFQSLHALRTAMQKLAHTAIGGTKPEEVRSSFGDTDLARIDVVIGGSHLLRS
ncbi:hypothetical protein LWI28_029047 [Acer negundo]|uniref:Uncharacterized protein n=1 Tax=Acer negundo TaxID=4023 RepID=A0AAD5IU33_ACENE|nr:hypothetical protein LWI28_029047 [Acer negundo]